MLCNNRNVKTKSKRKKSEIHEKLTGPTLAPTEIPVAAYLPLNGKKFSVSFVVNWGRL